MASLRARLLVAVLGPHRVGMLLLGGITYAEQRSFLIERLDEQARARPAWSSARSTSGDGEARGPSAGPPGGGGRASGCRRASTASGAARTGRVATASRSPSTRTAAPSPTLPDDLPARPALHRRRPGRGRARATA